MFKDGTLSICIPTFSNPSGIEKTISNLFVQASKDDLTKAIEFCVADNSEDESTTNIIKRLRDKNNIAIKYLRHGTNLGYDRNVDAVLKLATSEYCWILSDNEDVSHKALLQLLTEINNDQTSGLFIICPENIPKERLVTYKNMESAIKSNHWWIPGGLVSRNIIKRPLIPHDLSQYFDNDWIHLSITFYVGSITPVTFISEKFVYDPEEKSRWAKDGKTFITYTNLLEILTKLPTPPYSSFFLQEITSRIRHGLFYNILSAKLFGLKPTKINFSRLRKALPNQWFWLALCFLAMITPVVIVKYGKKLKHTIGH